jgi:hypothetical protein
MCHSSRLHGAHMVIAPHPGLGLVSLAVCVCSSTMAPWGLCGRIPGSALHEAAKSLRTPCHAVLGPESWSREGSVFPVLSENMAHCRVGRPR